MVKLTASAPSPRADQFLTDQLPDFSRSKLQSFIKAGFVLINDRPCKAKQSIATGDVITIVIPETNTDASPQAQDIPLDILYEDDDLIVIHKAHGMVVHPAEGNPDGTVVNALLHHCRGQLAPRAGTLRPGIVHRLDKDTSGCLVAAKTDLAHESLTAQFASRETEKRYFAVVQGRPMENKGTIFTHIGRHPVHRQKMAVIDPPNGKTAITDYEFLAHDPETNSSLILCHLHTGRTHQIRVHLLHLGHPLIGDPIYAKPQKQIAQTGRLMLHAWQLVIQHPVLGEKMEFTAPLPEEFQKWFALTHAHLTGDE